MALVPPPPANRTRVERLTHLREARCMDSALAVLEREDSIIPAKIAVGEYTARLDLEAANKIFVTNVEDRTARENTLPMIHQIGISAEIPPELGEVVGAWDAIASEVDAV